MKLGDKVRDIVTGFEGIAVGRCEYLNGCVQFSVMPGIDKDGKRQESEWIDAGTLEVVEAGVVKVRRYAEEPGGPQTGAPAGEYRG